MIRRLRKKKGILSKKQLMKRQFVGADYSELLEMWGLEVPENVKASRFFSYPDSEVRRLITRYIYDHMGMDGYLEGQVKEDLINFLQALDDQQLTYWGPIYKALIEIANECDEEFVRAFLALLPHLWT